MTCPSIVGLDDVGTETTVMVDWALKTNFPPSTDRVRRIGVHVHRLYYGQISCGTIDNGTIHAQYTRKVVVAVFLPMAVKETRIIRNIA